MSEFPEHSAFNQNEDTKRVHQEINENLFRSVEQQDVKLSNTRSAFEQIEFLLSEAQYYLERLDSSEVRDISALINDARIEAQRML